METKVVSNFKASISFDQKKTNGFGRGRKKYKGNEKRKEVKIYK